jgi:peptidoglycan hydrolase-like protein with peptidoglycan-binding domain
VSRHPRRIVLAGLGLLAVAVVLVVGDPFGGTPKPSGASDNATRTSLASVTRQTLSSQTQVGATLGYAEAGHVRVPIGTPPSTVAQAEQAVSHSETMSQSARESLASDIATLANAEATVSASRQKKRVDCAGDNAAKEVPGASSACASDVQALTSEQQSLDAATMKVQSDRTSLSSAAAALSGAETAASTARSTSADYSQGSTFTMLPTVGVLIKRGESLFALSGHPAVLFYGQVVPSRAFVAGMSPGSDVAALNANLEALGYGTGSSGETFSAQTAAAIRAFQVARGMTVTGELLLGSVVFERGPVRVTTVTPEVGTGVTAAPVLGITSTRRQVVIALSASEQSSVKVGDQVSISLPNERTTPGVVSSVGTVAKAPASKEGGGPEGGEEAGATVEVDVKPREPRAIGHLDEAPVEVSINTASVPDALCVPVDALLALAGGGYALEVAEGAAHRLESVTTGLFDDAEGLVQVSGPSVRAGQRVVVPST